MIFLLFFLSACNGKKEETPVIPPLTSPLSQSFVGFGVVNVSYTRVTAAPEEDSLEYDGGGEITASGSASYLRQGSVVRILQRRQVKSQDKLESWVQVDESGAGSTGSAGWLRESLVDIYDSEGQARTASEAMGR